MALLKVEKPVVLCVGDSISDDLYVSPKYPKYVGNFMAAQQVIPVGVLGDTTTNLIATRLTSKGVQEYPWYDPVARTAATYNIGQIAFFLMGVNDLIQQQPTAAALWSNLQQIYTALAGYGMQVRPIPILPFGNDKPNTFQIANNSSTAGAYVAGYGGQTVSVPWNATAAQVATAMMTLSTLAGATITPSGGPLPGSTVTMTITGIALTQAFSLTTTGGAGSQMYCGWTPYSETVRTTIRANILASGRRYCDMEARMGTGGSQPAMQAAYDSGDGLHPNDLGARQMAVCAALS